METLIVVWGSVGGVLERFWSASTSLKGRTLPNICDVCKILKRVNGVSDLGGGGNRRWDLWASVNYN